MKKGFLALLLCIVLLLPLVVLGEGTGDIYFVSKDAGSSYWQTVANGALGAGEALGVKVVVLAPNSESEIDKQISMVEQAVTAGASAVVVAPLDLDALVQPCRDVMSKDIPLTIVDSLISTDDYDAAFMTNNYDAGAMAADELAKLVGEEGPIFIINAVAGSQACIDRESGFRARMAEAYPNITIAGDTLFCNNDKITAANQTIDTMAAFPDLKGFYGPNENAMVGIANGLKESGKAGEVFLIGFDSSDDSIALLEEGAITAMILQDPYNMGYMGVEYALKIINGEEVEHGIIDTGATVATQENMNSEVIQKLFYPLGK